MEYQPGSLRRAYFLKGFWSKPRKITFIEKAREILIFPSHETVLRASFSQLQKCRTCTLPNSTVLQTDCLYAGEWAPPNQWKLLACIYPPTYSLGIYQFVDGSNVYDWRLKEYKRCSLICKMHSLSTKYCIGL